MMGKPGKQKNSFVVKHRKNRQNKINLVFDDVKRREFLTGFHKRKLQRQKAAKEQFEKDLKEERKRLKAEAKDSYKKLVVSSKPIPEVQHLLEEEYEDDEVTVKVVELTSQEMAEQNNWIGANQPKQEDTSEEEQNETDDDNADQKDFVPGMELKQKPLSLKSKQKQAEEFNTEKDIKKVLKKQATKNVQKSKVFQKKNKLEQQKQRKNNLKLKKEKQRLMKKKQKHKGH